MNFFDGWSNLDNEIWFITKKIKYPFTKKNKIYVPL